MCRILYTDYYKSNTFVSIKDIISDTKLIEIFGDQTREQFYETFKDQSKLENITICDKERILEEFSVLIEKALQITGINREEISYILHTDYMNDQIKNMSVPYYLAEKFKIKNAKIATIQQGCSGTLYSMGMAMSILNKKQKYMMILSSSVVPENEERFLGYTVWADGLGIMIISCEEGQYSLTDWKTYYNCLDFYEESKRVDFGRQSIVDKGITLIKDMVAFNDLNMKDIDKFVPQNIHYNGYVYQYGRSLGLSEERIFTTNISRYGHGGDVDTIINVHDYMNQSTGYESNYSILYGMGGNDSGRCYHSILLKREV